MPREPLEKIEPGMRIGNLTVLKELENTQEPMWLVICECGNMLAGADTALRNYDLHSCGCSDRDKDLTGQKFGMMTVLQRMTNNPYGVPLYLCRCDCGTEKIVRGDYLRKFHKPSCGCINRAIRSKSRRTHGFEYHPLTPIWRAMMSRCENPNNKDYKHYGGRGITVCERWHKLENFIEDMAPTYKPGLQLDRTDNEKGYSPENCRWVTQQENARNKRNTRYLNTAIGRKSLAEQSAVSKVPAYVITRRIDKGMPEELSIIPGRTVKQLPNAMLGKLINGDEAVWGNDKSEQAMSDIIETARIQAKAIREWGIGPDEIILGQEET